MIQLCLSGDQRLEAHYCALLAEAFGDYHHAYTAHRWKLRNRTRAGGSMMHTKAPMMTGASDHQDVDALLRL